MEDISIRLFGGFDARFGDQPFKHCRYLAEYALLAVLVTRHDQQVDRVTLGEILYPDQDATKQRNNVRQVAHFLSKALGRTNWRLALTRKALSFHIDDLPDEACDIVAFDNAICRGDAASLEVAVDLYRGHLLDGFDVRGALLADREKREQDYLSALEKLVCLAVARNSHREEARLLRKIIETAPERESAYRQLMQSLSKTGDTAEVKVVYSNLRAWLKGQCLGEPEDETTELLKSLQRGHMLPVINVRNLGNLPRPTTRFIGRGAELRQVARVLSTRRMVSLTGPPGIGKTRLAIAVAETVEPDFPDGIWYVDLSNLEDANRIPETIMAVFGIKIDRGIPPLRLLIEYLRVKRLLIVLDNCEHLAPECSEFVRETLLECRRLWVLACSRRMLFLGQSETNIRVSPVSLPEASDVFRDTLPRYDAVQLFVERAVLVSSDFTLDDQNSEVIAKICVRLEGIPLALELAASRVRTLALRDILDNLSNRFLGDKEGTALGHLKYSTLDAAIAWSHDLLSVGEQILFRRLAILEGTWSLAAAQAICSGPPTEVEMIAGVMAPLEDEVLYLLSNLVAKSLVIFRELEGEGRYTLLQCIREYGATRLLASTEDDTVRRHHFMYFTALATLAGKGSEEDRALGMGMLESEYVNLRTAFKWSMTKRDPGENTLLLGCALAGFWDTRGYYYEGLSLMREALKKRRGCSQRTIGLAMCIVGLLANQQGDFDAAQDALEESLAIRRKANDEIGTLETLRHLGNVAYCQGKFEKAREYYDVCHSLCVKLNDDNARALVLSNLGLIALHQHELDAAYANLTESLSIAERNRAIRAQSLALNNLGNYYYESNKLGLARSHYEASLAIKRELGDIRTIATSLHNLGNLAMLQVDLVTARQFLSESLTIHKQAGIQRGIAYSLEAFASLSVATGHYKKAARLYGASAAMRERISAPLPVNDQPNYQINIALCIQDLGEAVFVSEQRIGASWPSDKAVVFALKST